MSHPIAFALIFELVQVERNIVDLIDKTPISPLDSSACTGVDKLDAYFHFTVDFCSQPVFEFLKVEGLLSGLSL